MNQFTVRIRGIGLFADSVLLWRTLAIAIAAALLALADIPVELSAQTVFPSQVTPPSLRPPAAGSGTMTVPGAEDLRVLPDTGIKKKKRSKEPDRTGGATENISIPREKYRRAR